ncbi:uncharacterized protein BO95DRAFT_467970 [Aspergillus brunneoviolaceus CBS 621.78]|uniref:Uncharacterized protein n=1 Tax=Aspergillus brunneoviolaceus CBS 621.78 TaxID=1450534 RepID=A0ACD1FW75_9EURO|nr:hypothetical protein BO95DRAFT_467970 [Aspergillus brunneoviolaceus CBS 621.78]RAH41227.1 hypothetical protein BO95DRAFT_467970 [Aspergillus brunneoviolaceus CBS 621.78]
MLVARAGRGGGPSGESALVPGSDGPPGAAIPSCGADQHCARLILGLEATTSGNHPVPWFVSTTAVNAVVGNCTSRSTLSLPGLWQLMLLMKSVDGVSSSMAGMCDQLTSGDAGTLDVYYEDACAQAKDPGPDSGVCRLILSSAEPVYKRSL